jgi:hypothetical protein
MDCVVCGALTGSWACQLHQSKVPKLVIGLCGRARHGKDFVAQIIHQRFQAAGLTCFTSSISEVVLREAQLQGLIRKDIARAECTRTELDVLVSLGHKGRQANEDFWIRQLSREILSWAPNVALIPGVRFPNEIAWLRRTGGVIVRVTRFNADGSLFIALDRDPNDPMETVLNRVVADYEIIATTGQQSWLEAQAHGLATHLIDNPKEKL